MCLCRNFKCVYVEISVVSIKNFFRFRFLKGIFTYCYYHFMKVRLATGSFRESIQAHLSTPKRF